MPQPLPFFNWSLKKAEHTEPDSFTRARIRIMYVILIFSLLKCGVGVTITGINEQWLQLTRAVIASAFYAVVLKFFLYRPDKLKLIAHLMLQVGVLVIWSNIFIYAHKVNLLTVQFVFMMMLGSFYTLGSLMGIVYSIAGTLPVVLVIALRGNSGIYLTDASQEIAAPGGEIMVILNFISIATAHYLFYKAFTDNIAEKERLNIQLQASTVEAHDLAQSRFNFLSTMSHELRTPLNSVIGISELLLAEKPEERQKENLRILQYSAHDLLSLINNVLDFNKMEADKLVLERSSFSLAGFVQNIGSVLRIKATKKKLSLLIDVDSRLQEFQVISDATRLAQVMYNIVGNAIKYTDEGSVTVRLEVIGTTAQKADVLFSIIDTGIGIPADQHESIFEMFTQVESQGKHRHGGTGLGLAIVKQALRLFDSDLQLESSPGKGSRFFFTISFDTAAAIVDDKQPLQPGKQDFSRLRILIAEDDSINRTIIEKQFGLLHIKPTIVEDGNQAFEAYMNGAFDALFVDLHMPVADGYTVVSRIRALPDEAKSKVFVVAFTASVTEQAQILASGFDDFLYKPVNMNDLREKLKKVAVPLSTLA